MNVQRISAITLRVADMARAISFYNEVLGLEVFYGGERAFFSSVRTAIVKDVILNLELGAPSPGWVRIIFYVEDVDDFHKYLQSRGINAPRPQNATWGERYFHLKDPDGYELSFAQPLQ